MVLRNIVDHRLHRHWLRGYDNTKVCFEVGRNFSGLHFLANVAIDIDWLGEAVAH